MKTEDIRIARVNEIECLILSLWRNKQIIKDKEFIVEICSKYGCAQRKAREYYEVAKLRASKRFLVDDDRPTEEVETCS